MEPHRQGSRTERKQGRRLFFPFPGSALICTHKFGWTPWMWNSISSS